MDGIAEHLVSVMEHPGGGDDKPARKYNREVGQRIRKARLAAGRSLPDVGRMLGVSYQQIEKYEGGVNTISAFFLTKVADYLDAPLLWLLRGEDNAGDNAPLPFRLTTKEYQLLEAFRAFKLQSDRTLVRRIIALIVAADNPGRKHPQ